MALFTLTIDNPRKRFGEMRHQEIAVIREALQAAAQSLGTMDTAVGEKFTGDVQLSDHHVVGHFDYEPNAAK